MAERNGFNPLDIVGDHPARPFQQSEADFTDKTIGNRDGSIGARPTGWVAPERRANVSEQGLSAIVDGLAGEKGGGVFDVEKTGLFYTPPGGQPRAIELTDEIANSPEYIAAYKAKFGVEPDLQVSVVGGQKSYEAIERDTTLGAVDAVVRGAADTMTLGLSDEIAAGADTIFGGGTMAGNLRKQRGIDALDERVNPYARLGGQIAGGFALPVPVGSNTVGQLAAVGGAYGGAYGFGSTNGDIGQRLLGAAGGATAGGIAGAGLGALGQLAASRLGGRTPPPTGGPTSSQELMAAAGRLGTPERPFPVMPADAGGPMTRRMTAGVVQTPFGTGPITRAADAVQSRAGEVLTDVAGGSFPRQEVLGEVGQRAGAAFNDALSTRARAGYGAARELAGDAPLQANKALEAIDGQLAELAPTSNTDASLIKGLETLRADIADGNGAKKLTIDAMRRLRTSTRAEAATEGLRATDYQRRSREILTALSDDIAEQLPPAAAAKFRAEDRAYAEGMEFVQDIINPLTGKGQSSAEEVANRLISMSRGDSARFKSVLNNFDPESSAVIRGSVIQEMGRSLPGQQNAAGTDFSLQTFLTNWDKMPDRTRNLLFKGEHRQTIEDLAKVADASRSARKYANTSGTAGATNASRFVSEGARAGSLGGMVTSLGGTVILENLTGRLLGSQRFAQWLARAPKDPAARGAWAKRLGVIATREPAIANDLLPIQQALQQAVPRAAAEDKPQDRRR